MATLIRIRRDAFRPHPRAGETQTTMAGLRYANRQVVRNDGDFTVFEHQRSNGVVEIASDGSISCDNWITIHTSRRQGATAVLPPPQTEIVQEAETVEHLPIQRWQYEYEPTQIRCSECGAVFSHAELNSDEIGDVIVRNICPACGEADCCDVDWENPDDVARELGIY